MEFACRDDGSRRHDGWNPTRSVKLAEIIANPNGEPIGSRFVAGVTTAKGNPRCANSGSHNAGREEESVG